MSVTCVVGTQWGDEGKGKIVDSISDDADLVVRFQGGDNAGHSVITDAGNFGLHLVPSGILRDQTVNLLGPGTAVNPESFLAEMASLHERLPDLEFAGRLYIAERAHVVMPYHVATDGAEEDSRGDLVQGTTRRGIGPAYADKFARSGIQFADLLDDDYLDEYLPHILEQKNRVLRASFDHAGFELADMLDLCRGWREQLAPFITDTFGLVGRALEAGENILLEGQLGIMRDIDWGHYPYVTSSSPTVAGACVSTGIPPGRIDRAIGVAKAFTSSVGEGPFPTELDGDIAHRLRSGGGGEYGVSTGRPRRVGWMDTVAIRHAARINGLTNLALTKMDLLDDFASIPVCTGYRLNGTVLDSVPTTHRLGRVEPVYEELPGWETETAGLNRWDDLPANARGYVERVEEIVGVPVSYVGTGQHREALIVRD